MGLRVAAPPSAAGAHVVMRRVVQPQPRTWRLRFRHARAGGQHASEAPLLASVLRCPESGLGALTCGASVGPRPPDAARSFGPCSRTCRRRRRPRSSLPPGREGDGDGGGGGGALAAPCHGGRVRGPRALWEAPCGLLSFGGGGGSGALKLGFASIVASLLPCALCSSPRPRPEFPNLGPLPSDPRWRAPTPTSFPSCACAGRAMERRGGLGRCPGSHGHPTALRAR